MNFIVKLRKYCKSNITKAQLSSMYKFEVSTPLTFYISLLLNLYYKILAAFCIFLCIFNAHS